MTPSSAATRHFLQFLLPLVVATGFIGWFSCLAIPLKSQADTKNVDCPYFRSGSVCGCPGLKSKEKASSSDGIQSDSPGHIETDEDGTQYLVIGDMMFRTGTSALPVEQADQVISDPTNPNYKLDLKFWPAGIIFYTIDPNFSLEYAEKILEAMKIIEENVGKQHLEFRKAQTSSGKICRKGYMFIKKAEKSQCRAEVGMRPTHTRVWLHQDSCPSGTIQHEILHALGRYHEQCRPDRDKYVTLIPENMAATECSNYQVAFDGVDPSITISYDSASIMHYGSCHFSCNGNYTMLRKDGDKIEANRQSMTKLDVDKMKALYPAEFKVQYRESMCRDKETEDKAQSALVGGGKSLLIGLAALAWLGKRCC